jgi:membrane associated rhomboid family serine protease
MRLPQSKFDGSYGPRRGPPIWRTRYWPMTTWLIVLNVAVFVVDALSGMMLTRWGALSVESLLHFQVWRLFTFQFLHAGPMHLVFNLLWLYFIGGLVEGRLSKRRMLVFYLLCGLAGGVAFILIWRLGTLGLTAQSELVGASGGIFGLTAAAAALWPRYPIRLWFPPVTLTLRVIFWIAIGLALLAIFGSGWNAGGEAAHLGGAARAPSSFATSGGSTSFEPAEESNTSGVRAIRWRISFGRMRCRAVGRKERSGSLTG